MTITWAEYDGIKNKDPKEAVYIVNGQQVGKGTEGFSKVLAKLRALPRGSTVYVYPDNRLRALGVERRRLYDIGRSPGQCSVSGQSSKIPQHSNSIRRPR